MIFNELTFDFTNILVILVSGVIIYFAWKSTNVRDDNLAPAALLIIENNRRRLLDSIVRGSYNTTNDLLHQANSLTITEDRTEGLEQQQSDRVTTSLENIHLPEAPPSLQAIIDEVNDLATTSRQTENNQQLLESVEEDINNILQETDTGPQRIIEIMDNPDSRIIERRRLTVFDESQTEGTASQTIPIRRENLNVPLSVTVGSNNVVNTDNFHADNCSNENNENENISKTEFRSTITSTSSSSSSTNTDSSIQDNTKGTIRMRRVMVATDSKDSAADTKKEFRIKLKYLNDELRMVKGSPNEAIGDFKRRNFTVELAAQKLVRLVFNGHVLQPDSKTLKACGLFDNCVVHCLIHNKKPSQEDNRNDQENQSNRNHDRGSNNFTAGGINYGVSLINFGIILSGLSIIFGWYCRFTYSFIFSWYSTIGLGIMTVIFLVLSPVLFLIERGVSL